MPEQFNNALKGAGGDKMSQKIYMSSTEIDDKFVLGLDFSKQGGEEIKLLKAPKKYPKKRAIHKFWITEVNAFIIFAEKKKRITFARKF